MNTDPRFPLGVPTNRPPTGNGLQPIAGRPHWFTDRYGAEHYREPARPPQPGASGGSP